jgi:DNA-binding response OmpR family regulator/HPt (histidine-containing phosphotransfer) domain-containing protein
MQPGTDADPLGGLKELYFKQLKERLATLEQAMLDIRLGLAGADAYAALEFEVHRLNGTGATYGFPRISATAESLEAHLRSDKREPATVMRLLRVLMGAITDTLEMRPAETELHRPVAVPKPQQREAYRPSVLAADDDPAILGLVVQLLSPGMHVECVQNGHAALEALERRRFDLVILDCEMPDMSGLEVLVQAARMETGLRSPVMMLSAVRDPERVSRLIAAGAQNYLVKPVAPSQLVERVALMLGRQKKIIMIVDDDPLIREIFRKRLTQRGHEVVLANNGAHALGLARRTQPQAIVLDRQMPRLDGIQFLQELRRRDETRTIPVIMLSARCASDDIYSGYREGANAYITKPFIPDQVIDCCEGFLRPPDETGTAPENYAFV